MTTATKDRLIAFLFIEAGGVFALSMAFYYNGGGLMLLLAVGIIVFGIDSLLDY